MNKVCWDFTNVNLCAYLLTRGCELEGKYYKDGDFKRKCVLQIKANKNDLQKYIKEYKSDEEIMITPKLLFANKSKLLQFMKF